MAPQLVDEPAARSALAFADVEEEIARVGEAIAAIGPIDIALDVWQVKDGRSAAPVGSCCPARLISPGVCVGLSRLSGA
jgi:hypothetical protein